MAKDKTDKTDNIKKEQERTTEAKKAMLEALTLSLGVVTTACKAANVSKSQFYKWKQDDPQFRADVNEIKNVALDFVESKLFEQIQNGNTPATIFYLKTQGKGRGYVERQEIDLGADKSPDFSGWTDEQIAAALNENQ